MKDENGGFSLLTVRDGQAVKLAMEGLWLTGQVLPVGALLTVVHSFRSDEKEPLEAVYAFGLPRDAALRRFKIEGEGFEVRSELRPVQEATEAYEQGVQEGHLSAMTRTYRDGRVNLSVGNIRPGELVKVFLEIVAGVDLRDDGYRFRFPFTLAPCYHSAARAAPITGGMEMELPAAEFGDVLLPPWMTEAEELHRVGFDLRLEWPGKLGEVGSPSHRVRVAPEKARQWRVSSAADGEVPNRDLVLDVNAKVAEKICYGGQLEKGRGVFTLVVPSDCFGAVEGEPRSVMFLLDRSGSMGGAPLEQAKRSLNACLGALEATDRFNLLVFDHETEVFQSSLVPATLENRKQAKSFLDEVQARGSTELKPALNAGLTLVEREGADLFLLTDGQVAATEEVLCSIRDRGMRVHCLGIGAASQDRFLTLLARQSGGICRCVAPGDRVDHEALELFASTGCCSAREITLKTKGWPGAKWVVTPSRHVFTGHPLVMHGEAPVVESGKVTLAYRTGEKKDELTVDVAPVGAVRATYLFQGALLITELETEHGAELDATARGDRRAKRWQKKLESVGRDYGLANRALSLVAVVEREGDDAKKLPLTKIVPVGLPEEMRPEVYLGLLGMRRGGTLGSSPHDVHSSRLHRSMMSGTTCDSRAPEPLHRRIAADQIKKIAGRFPPVRSELMEILAGLDADGGLPGDNLAERLIRTIALLAACRFDGHSTRHGCLRTHLVRMTAFLRHQCPQLNDEKARLLVKALLEKIDREEAVELEDPFWALRLAIGEEDSGEGWLWLRQHV